MANIRSDLTQMFSQAFASKGLDAKWGQVTRSDRPDLAQFQCNGALPAAKTLKRPPRDVAQELTAEITKLAEAKYGPGQITLSLAGPGFINIVLSDALIAKLNQAHVGDSRVGVPALMNPKKVVIDYGGPNVAKAMHVGHLRSSIIGDSLAKLHRFLGNTVVGDNHLGDWGTQMGMLICALKEAHPEYPYFDPSFSGEYPKESPVTLAQLEEMYPAASKRYGEDETFKKEVLKATDELQKGRKGYKALWQHFVNTTVADLRSDFAKLGITFDLWLGESFFEDLMPVLVEKLKAKGVTQMSEGALVIPLADEKEPEMPPVILVKSGGGFLYHTSDLATIDYRVNEMKADTILYVVDKRQTLHFKQIFKAAKIAGIAGQAEMKHLPFGTMNGTDGKPFKTRSGGVIKLKDLIQMIMDEAKKRVQELEGDRAYSSADVDAIAEKVGIATLKFADLKHNRAVDYVFDLDKFSRFEGHTGPYLLYATVRIKSILRKAAEQGLKPGTLIAPTQDVERKLLLELLNLPEVLLDAAREGEPHPLCEYGFNLSQSFNAFYKDCHILRESDPARQASWLAICQLTHDTLELVLGLLGISVPEKM